MGSQKRLEEAGGKSIRGKNSPPLASATTEVTKTQSLAPPKCLPAPQAASQVF